MFTSPNKSISEQKELTPIQWYPEVLHFCPYTPLILVGLKSDLRYRKTCIDMLKTQGLTPVTTEQGLAVAKKMGAQYMECSSKEMKGVEEIFERAILTVVANDRKTLEAEALANGGASGGSSSGGKGGLAGLGRKGSTAMGGHGHHGSVGGGGVTFGSDGVQIPVVKKKKRKCALV